MANSERAFEIPSGQLPQTQSELYQRLSWVHIAVSTVATTAAGAQFSVRQRVGLELKDIENHPFELLLQHPNPFMSRFELMEATVSFRALTGNAYWWLNRQSANDAPSEIWLIPSHQIAPVPDGKLYIKGYLYDPQTGGEKIPLEPYEIIHFKRFNPLNRYVGLSPIEALATVAIGDMKMAQWNTNHFAKDNAKMPGFLSFADAIGDGDWERMKADINKQYGGTQRRLMMLRNVGKGGVEWVATAMSQKDMEFLAGRTFNKEEIYSVFAPGLSSVLAVNATEANSIAGKATFSELAVWPQHVAMAEKITNDLLPVYGADLVGEFDDVRISDRQMELQEQTAFERVHTVAEVRKKFYGDAPLGDERDDLLITELGKLSAPPQFQQTPPDMDAPDEDMPEDMPPEDENEDDTENEAVKAELAKWQRYALTRVKEGKPEKALAFKSDVLPFGVKNYLVGALEGANTVEAVRLVFVGASEWSQYP